MCYSGKCRFEDYAGECRAVSAYTIFNDKTQHWDICTFAETPTDPESEEYIKEQRHNLAFQYCKKLLIRKIINSLREVTSNEQSS